MNESAGIKYYSGRRGLSSSVLKIIAVATMLLDHTAVVFEEQLNEALPFLFRDNGFSFLRVIGRVAFPLFAFLIAEGAGRTKNIYKYMLRLLVFAFVSEIPFDLALYHTPPSEVLRETQHQNVFFTLLLGLAAIWAFRMLQKKRLDVLGIPVVLVLAYVAEMVLKTDYGAMGVLCIFLLYLSLHAPNKLKYAGIVFTLLILPIIITATPYFSKFSMRLDVSLFYNDYETAAILALPLILLYNGEKGRKINKYFFYGFYPGHLLILWGLLMLIAGNQT